MEIGALDELAGGRVRLGIGSGIGFAIERMGFSYGKPLTTLREAIVIVRALLRGEEVTHAGTVFNVKNVKLDLHGARRYSDLHGGARRPQPGSLR